MQRFKWIKLVLFVGVALGMSACEDDVMDLELTPPTGLAVTETDEGLSLSWDAVADAESYTIRRSVGGGSPEDLETGLTTTSYVDTSASTGETYTYTVRAVAGDEFQTSDPVTYVWGEAVATLTGTLAGDRSLSADTVYTLQGTVTVPEDVTLTIEAGTLVLGDFAVQPTALIVRQGGMIVANGTADAPIVFTSSRPAGERARGDWGGIIINGRSICNFPDADDCVAEGFPATYGGDVLDDNSGSLSYVRIEFAGYEVSLGNELNALTLNGVGSGTNLDHIQTHMGLDDGFEFFGGTVDLKYAVATGISDDSFDYSTGWAGRGQFWIALQDPNDADTGFEVDGNEKDHEALPWTQPVIYNITLVGKGPSGGTAGESTDGLKLRRGTAGIIRNAIVMGYGSAGLELDDAATRSRCETGDLIVSNSIFFENASYLESDSDSIEAGCTAEAEWTTLLQEDPGLGDPYNWSDPDFVPESGSAAATASNAAAVPAGPFWTAVDYVGAVDPSAATPWYEGWTTFSVN